MSFVIKISKHWQVSSICGISIALTAYAVLSTYYFLKDVSPPLVVRFISREGVVRTGSLFEIVSAGIVVWGFIVVNSFLAIELEEKDWFWGKFVAAVTFVISLLLFMGLRAIINVN